MFQALVSHSQRDRLVREGRHRDQAGQSTFEFSHVALRFRCNKDANILGQENTLRFGLLVENGHFRLEIGSLNVYQQAPFKPGAQSLDETGKLARSRVARNHQLLLVIVEFIEGVEELFLGPLFSCNDVDIVNEKDVGSSVMAVKERHTIEL